MDKNEKQKIEKILENEQTAKQVMTAILSNDAIVHGMIIENPYMGIMLSLPFLASTKLGLSKPFMVRAKSRKEAEAWAKTLNDAEKQLTRFLNKKLNFNTDAEREIVLIQVLMAAIFTHIQGVREQFPDIKTKDPIYSDKTMEIVGKFLSGEADEAILRNVMNPDNKNITIALPENADKKDDKIRTGATGQEIA